MRRIGYLWIITILSTILLWLPFFLSGTMTKVFANFDGPNYMVIAKCWYERACIGKNFSLPLPFEYYPAHFPGYPFLIYLFDLITTGWQAMLFANLAATGLMVTVVYLLLESLKVKNSFWLSIIALFLPARMLILRTVGAPETLFIATLLTSMIFFRKEKYWLSGIFLAAAQAIKTPAILLFAAYLITIFIKDKLDFKKWFKKMPLILGPLTVLAVFYFFKLQTGDFMAYFHSGDNFHLTFPPFQAFISSRSWLGDFWLEDLIYIYLLSGLSVVYLFKKYRTDIIVIFPAVFYLATLFVAHRDLSRYSAPLYPFWLMAFSDLLGKKEFKIVFFIILPAIYLYSINFINYNIAPVADWTPYR